MNKSLVVCSEAHFSSDPRQAQVDVSFSVGSTSTNLKNPMIYLKASIPLMHIMLLP